MSRRPPASAPSQTGEGWEADLFHRQPDTGTPRNRGAGSPRRREPLMFTVEDAADQLRLSVRFIRRQIAAGALPAHRFGSTIRISSDDLARYVAGSRKA